MAIFDELLKKDHVKNHPLFKQREQRIKSHRINRKLHAQMLEDEEDLNDMFSKGETEEDDKSLSGLIRSAVRATERLMTQFDFPIYPKISFNNTRNVKYASHNPNLVVAGSVLLNCQIKTLNGMNKLATISVPIDRGEVIPPAVMEINGRLYTIGQASIDELVERSTSYETQEIRDIYDPPLEGDERVMAVENKYEMGYTPRDSGNIFDTTKRGSTSSDVHGAYEVVTEAMREAAKEGTDVFPRQWSHLAQEYIVPIIGSASPDAWMSPLINEGFCINPWGVNRGRPTTTASKKKSQYEDEEDLFDEDEEPIDEPEDEDAFIKDSGSRGYSASLGSDFLGYFNDYDEAEEEIRNQMKKDQYWPNAWFIDDHGGIDLITDFYRESRKTAQMKPEPLDPDDFLEGDDSSGDNFLDDTEIEPRLYPDTKTPMESGDKVKFEGKEGPIRGKILTIDPEDDYLIIESGGIRYQVHCEDIQPMPSTFSKMWK